jgi:hypothetical protein
MNKNEKNTANISETEIRGEITAPSKKTKKRNGRFNFIDFFLIMIILAVISVALIYLVPGLTERISSASETEITYVLEFKGVDVDFIANIQNGDGVYSASESFKIGTVKSVATDSYTTLVYDQTTNAGVLVEHPSLKTLIVTVKASAVYDIGVGYSVNGERIAVGREFYVRTPGFTGTAYCIEVETSNK